MWRWLVSSAVLVKDTFPPSPLPNMDSPVLGNFSAASHCWELGGGSDVFSHVPNLLLLANILKGKDPR